MKLNFHPTRAAVLVGAALLSATFAFPAMAAGGASGPKVAYMAQGNIGEVMVNPYRIAPLTAVIRSGGYVVKNASVRLKSNMTACSMAKPNTSPIAISFMQLRFSSVQTVRPDRLIPPST